MECINVVYMGILGWCIGAFLHGICDNMDSLGYFRMGLMDSL